LQVEWSGLSKKRERGGGYSCLVVAGYASDLALSASPHQYESYTLRRREATLFWEDQEINRCGVFTEDNSPCLRNYYK